MFLRKAHRSHGGMIGRNECRGSPPLPSRNGLTGRERPLQRGLMQACAQVTSSFFNVASMLSNHPLSRDATPSRSQPSLCVSGVDSMMKAAIPGPGPLLRAGKHSSDGHHWSKVSANLDQTAFWRYTTQVQYTIRRIQDSEYQRPSSLGHWLCSTDE